MRHGGGCGGIKLCVANHNTLKKQLAGIKEVHRCEIVNYNRVWGKYVDG